MSDFRGLTPKNVTPISRALPVLSGGKPLRPRRGCFAVLGYQRGGPQNFPGFGGNPPNLRELTPKNRFPVYGADARLLARKPSPPARVFCVPLKEAGGPAQFFRFWR